MTEVWGAAQNVYQLPLRTLMGEWTTPLHCTNGCRNEDMIQLGSLSSQSLFQFVQISDEYFVQLLLHYSTHAVIYWIRIWRIWRHISG